MTQQQFEQLRSLIELNAQGISRNHETTQQRFQELSSLIRVNYKMIGRIYEEHGGRLGGLEGRLTRVEVGQEQLSDDLRAVAEGVTGNGERLDRLDGRVERLEGHVERLDGRFDQFEVNFEQLSTSVAASFADHEQRLRAVED